MSTNKNSSSSPTVCKNLEFGIYSRRAFRNEYQGKASPREVYLSKQSNKGSRDKSEEKPWPKSVRIAGYTMVVLGIPYSILTLISESPSLQDFLQEYSYGRTLMEKIIRPYWGHVDAYPYVDDDEDAGISLYNEPSAIVRKAQDEIHSLCDDQADYNVEILHTEAKNDTSYSSIQRKDLNLSGSTLVSPLNVARKLNLTTNDDEITVLALEFLDTQNDSDSLVMDKDEIQMVPANNNIGEHYLRNITSTWSTWHYFNKNPGNNENSSNTHTATNTAAMDTRPVYDESEMARLELEHNLQLLQTEYNDPNSTRDRDDLIQDIEKYKKELRQLKKHARWNRVKAWFSG